MRRHTFGFAPRKSINVLVGNPVYQAFARKPMAQSLQATQAIDARMAFNAVTHGTATPDDYETLGGVCNCIMVLAEKHCIEADLEATQDAQKAILRAQARWLDGKAWNFDGEGRAAMLAALDIFEQMVAQIGYGAVAAALVTVLDRCKRGQVHRFEGVVA